jgi:hypothetical protein
MTQNRKYILDKFEEHLFQKYEAYCKTHDKQPTSEGLLTFLIDHDLIPPIAIKRFAVKGEFDKLAEHKYFNKTQSVHVLSDLFNIPERTIWGILKYSKG